MRRSRTQNDDADYAATAVVAFDWDCPWRQVSSCSLPFVFDTPSRTSIKSAKRNYSSECNRSRGPPENCTIHPQSLVYQSYSTGMIDASFTFL